MLTDVANVKFESKNDIVDYICKGVPPTRKNYEAAIGYIETVSSYRNLRTVDEDENEYYDRIRELQIEDEVFRKCIDEVYKCRCRNRNITIGLIGVATVAALYGFFGSGGQKEKD